MPKNWKGTLWGLTTSILSQNIKKIEGRPFEEFSFEKKSHNAEKTERAPFGIFNIHSVAKHQKIEGGPFGEFF